MGSSGSSASIPSASSTRVVKGKRHNLHHLPRKDYHAGSWYDSGSTDLNRLLSEFMEDAGKCCHEGSDLQTIARPRAIISPHAGYSYSGPTAAYAYLALQEAVSAGIVKRIIVLHPSHHVSLDGCAVSGASELVTPIKNLPVDSDLRDQLLSTGSFTVMNKRVDEEEHSGEMQYPYIAKVFIDVLAKSQSNREMVESIKVLPIMVGGIQRSKEKMFGEVLAPFLVKSDTFVIISSDFCHWGNKFQYCPPFDQDYRKRGGGSVFELRTEKVHEYIKELDRMGMDHIQMQQPGAFADYLSSSRNTICGRHPIAVWLYAIEANDLSGKEHVEIKFVKYAQSSQVTRKDEMSVSYASAVARVKVLT